jgi:hypothetical protein
LMVFEMNLLGIFILKVSSSYLVCAIKINKEMIKKIFVENIFV